MIQISFFFLLCSILTAPLALAQGGAAPAGGGSMQLIIIVLMFAGMYFLIIAPQRKRQKEHAAMVAAIKPGDRVITAGGIHGKVTQVRDDKVSVRVAPEVVMDFSKGSIATKLGSESEG